MGMKLGKDNRRLDLGAVQNGRKVDCPIRPGVSVAVKPAAAFNPAFAAALRDKALTEQVGVEDSTQWLIEFTALPDVLVSALVGDITGIFDEDDEEVAYTPDVGLEIFRDESQADFRLWCGMKAREYADFYAKELRDDEGNSDGGSSGSSDGAAGSRRTRRSKR